VYEFGPFALDPSTQTLTCAGQLVSVGPKAFDLLLFLIEEEGRVVSKEEILERVWPGAYVEEGNIFQTISVLRKVLNPHFEGSGPIVTVARRGYRFAVEMRKRVPDCIAQSTLTAPAVELTPPEVPPMPPASATIGSRRVCLALGLSVVTLLAAALAFYPRATAHGAKDRKARRAVAVLPFQSLSGNRESAWVSAALAETVTSELAAGGEIRTIASDRVTRMLKDLSLAPQAERTGGAVGDIRNNLGCDLILTGSYLEINGQIRLDVRLIDGVSPEPLATLSETDDARNLLGLVVRTGAQLRAKIGVPALRASQSEGIRSSISPDPNAAMLYFRGLAAARMLDRPAAKGFFEQAIAADKRFALAHSGLASALGSLGQDKAAAQEAKLAFDNSQGLSREDRLNIEAQYYIASSNWAKASETYRQLWRQFPDNIEYILKIGQTAFNAVRGKDVLAAVEEARAMPAPARADPRIDILETTGAQLIGDYAGAEAAAARAVESATKAKAPLFLATALVKRAGVEERKGAYAESLADYAEAQRTYESLGDRQGAADSLRLQAGILRRQGKLDEALRQNESALKVSREIGYQRLTGRILAQIGLVHQMQGRPPQALKALTEAVQIGRATGDKGGLAGADLTLGLVLRQTGDLSGAEAAYAEAGAICRELSDPLGLASTLNSSGSVNISRGKLDVAATQLAEAEQIFRKLGNRKSLAQTLSNVGAVAFLQGDLRAAAAVYKEECDLHAALDEKGALASCRVNQAMAQLEMGQTKEAMEAVRQVMASSESGTLSALDWAHIVTIQIAGGELGAGRKSVEEGRRRAAKSHDPEQTIPLTIAAARLDEAAGNRAAAAATLPRVRAEAEHYGLKPLAEVARTGLVGVLRPRTTPVNARR
jgi:DNA-binding winged helix-turn-helix (wHTH) protein/tetratricopeptide (TPR) repeat protein